VVRVEETRDETVLPFAEVKAQVKAQLAVVKGEQKALALAEEVVTALEAGNDAILADNELAFSEQESIDRGSPLAAKVFAMAKPAEGQPGFTQTKDFQGNIVIVELSKVTANIDTSFNTQIAAQLVRAGTQQDLDAVLAVLREQADIEYYVVSAQP
jgi:peptidyl-prolyl cis-trans isomerase D